MLDCKRGGKTGKTGAAHARSTSPFFDNFSRVNHSLKKKKNFSILKWKGKTAELGDQRLSLCLCNLNNSVAKYKSLLYIFPCSFLML